MLKVHALHYLLTDISFMETFLCLLPKLLSGLCWNAKFLWSCSIADIVVLQHPKHLFITIFSLSQHLLALTYVIYSIPSEFWKSTVMSSKYKVIFATKARLTDQPNIFYNLFDLWSEKQKRKSNAVLSYHTVYLKKLVPSTYITNIRHALSISISKLVAFWSVILSICIELHMKNWRYTIQLSWPLKISLAGILQLLWLFRRIWENKINNMFTNLNAGLRKKYTIAK